MAHEESAPSINWTQEEVKAYIKTKQEPVITKYKVKVISNIRKKKQKRIGTGKPGPGRKPKIDPNNVARKLMALEDDVQSYSIAKATPAPSVIPATPASSVRATA